MNFCYLGGKNAEDLLVSSRFFWTIDIIIPDKGYFENDKSSTKREDFTGGTCRSLFREEVYSITFNYRSLFKYVLLGVE